MNYTSNSLLGITFAWEKIEPISNEITEGTKKQTFNNIFPTQRDYQTLDFGSTRQIFPGVMHMNYKQRLDIFILFFFFFAFLSYINEIPAR